MFNEKGSEVEIIISQVILITVRLIVPFNTWCMVMTKNRISKILSIEISPGASVGNVPVSHHPIKYVPEQIFTYILFF